MVIEKVIFLDIDGVIALTYGINLPQSEWLLGTAYPFDPPCVEVLNQILKKTDAEIVLTSQWRVDYSIDELDEIFIWNKVAKIPIAITTYVGGFSRCFEIENFLAKNRVKKFVIIDDMKLDCYPKNFIHTNMDTGLNSKHIELITKML